MFNRSLQQRSSNHNYSLHMQRAFTQNWLNSFWTAVACSVLSFILHGKQSYEWTWRGMSLPSRNLYKCKQVACSVVVVCCVYPLFFYTALCCCLFTSLTPFVFILMLLLYFGLFVDHVTKPIILVFEAFSYHLKNAISILVIKLWGFYLLKTFIYGFVNCKSSKKKYVF